MFPRWIQFINNVNKIFNMLHCLWIVQFSKADSGNIAQTLSCVQLFVTPWTAARPASLSFTISRNLLKLMSIESVLPSNHLIQSRAELFSIVRARQRTWIFFNTWFFKISCLYFGLCCVAHMWDLNSQTRDWTQTCNPCIGSTESQLMDPQRSPRTWILSWGT